MKNFFAMCLLLLCAAQVPAQTTAADAQLTARVNAFVDSWHDDAANTRMAYFEKMAPDGVYIGTDKTELWHREAFKVWAKPYFDSKKAWTFKATRRNVYWSPDRKVIWFDELLDTQMGVCQASGVLHPTPTGFAIDHYQLSMAVPNDVAASVTKTIKQFEATPPVAKPTATPGAKAAGTPAATTAATSAATSAAAPAATSAATSAAAPAATSAVKPVSTSTAAPAAK